jgi:hypothetical protein
VVFEDLCQPFVARAGYKVIFFTTEIDPKTLLFRLIHPNTYVCRYGQNCVFIKHLYIRVAVRVARFFLGTIYQSGGKYTYQMTTK